MREYKLLTPGPLTTSKSVKNEMKMDRCTWDDEYKLVTQKIRSQLLDLAHVSPEEYTCVLMQGSGSFSVESVMQTAFKETDKALIITNGAYGKRIVEMANYLGINYVEHAAKFDQHPELDAIEYQLKNDPAITHVVMVHCETTTGILNPLAEVAAVAKAYDKTLIIDAMSSFGGIEMDVAKLGIDYLISSANKCIQGVPGFGFVIAKLAHFKTCAGNAHSLSLDLYDQWLEMNPSGKWRYTSPTHVVAAFSKALDELYQEGGVRMRQARYTHSNALIRHRFEKAGIKAYISEEKQSPIIATYLYPNDAFDFDDFYAYVKGKGFVLYPGKLTEVDTFRVGNIGEIYEEDIARLCDVIDEYMGVVVK